MSVPISMPLSPITGILKVAACLLLLLMLLQPVLAGQYFGGNSAVAQFHGLIGEATAWTALSMLLLALLGWRVEGLPGWTVGALAAVFGGTGLQVHLGHAGQLALHIPLGAILLAATAMMTLRLLRLSPPVAPLRPGESVPR